MQLTDDQKQKVRDWAQEGCGLSEIQRRINAELGIPMTYMDVRFLIIELSVEIREKARPKENAKLNTIAAAADADDGGSGDEGADLEAEPEPAAPGAASRLTLSVDHIMKPGSIVSGSVTFSDGVKGSWSLDQLGRLALDMGEKQSYRPSPADIETFQVQLQEQLGRRGM